MSTRAVISVQGLDGIYIYKHSDGYPEGTLPWLEAFNKDFSNNRGDDPEYKIAQLLRDSARSSDQFGLSDSKYTGWGIMVNINSDIEYIYTLHSNGKVTYKKGNKL